MFRELGTKMEPSSRDLVLMALLSADNEIRGRTTIQKLTYFYGVETGINTGHKAHFYGPYSRAIADSLSSLVSMGVVEEDVNSVGGGVRYTYKLSKVGEKIAKSLAKRFNDVYGIILSITETSEVETSLNSRVLAIASKVYYSSIKSQKDAITYSEIRDQALRLGWNLESKEINEGAKLLVSLGLATQH
jgi:uncharacterized protein YwgA